MTQAFDRKSDVLPLTRVTAALLLPFLLAAGSLLYIWPDRTAENFAWTIMPPATALVMGAGYFSGLYFFARATTADRWGSIALGFPPIAVFAWLAGVTTILHWDRFHHDHISFFAWATLYAITPFIVPGLWLFNRSRSAPLLGQNLSMIPAPAAGALGAAGLGVLLTGAALFIFPEAMIPVWPWTLSPLTARILGSFFILVGLVDLSIAADRRWAAVRLVLESQLVGLALMLLAVPRALDFIDRGSPLAAALFSGISLLWIGIMALYFWMRKRSWII